MPHDVSRSLWCVIVLGFFIEMLSNTQNFEEKKKAFEVHWSSKLAEATSQAREKGAAEV